MGEFSGLCVGLVVGGIVDSSPIRMRLISPSRQNYFSSCCYPRLFSRRGIRCEKTQESGHDHDVRRRRDPHLAFVVGYFTYACARAGIVDVDATNPMEALLFGALISAVDPVAT